MTDSAMIDAVFAAHPAVRYVAVYLDGELSMASRPEAANQSDSESDRYEELLVNPAVLTLAAQRGNIDCGGLEYVLIRYGSFFQLVCPHERGHVSVCVERDADPVAVAELILPLVARGAAGDHA